MARDVSRHIPGNRVQGHIKTQGLCNMKSIRKFQSPTGVVDKPSLGRIIQTSQKGLSTFRRTEMSLPYLLTVTSGTDLADMPSLHTQKKTGH